jgi:DNA-binding NarL/FixJ family response regulator
MEVVGEAGSEAEAVRRVGEAKPDVVVMDLRLGEGSGIEACREIKSRSDASGQAPRVVIFSAHSGPDDVAGATLAGADGYVHKGAGSGDLLDALKTVHEGGRAFLLPGGETDAGERLKVTPGEAPLTNREKEVLALMLRRRTNPEISSELYISLHTVKNHVASILRKLGLKSRRELS